MRSVRALTLIVVFLALAPGASAAETFLGPYAWGASVRADTNRSGAAGLELACPSISLCVGVDKSGGLVTSTAPAQSGSWSFGQLARTDCNLCGVFDRVSCPSVTLCVAFDRPGNVFTSRSPAAGVSSWTSAPVGSTAMHPLSCPSPALCVAGDGTGILLSADPAGGSWQRVTMDTAPCASSSCPDSAPEITAVTCQSAQLCVAGDGFGRLFVSGDPAGASAWRQVYADSAVDVGPTDTQSETSIADVACPSASRCIATDSNGNVIRSSDPLGAGSWTRQRVFTSFSLPPRAIARIACPTDGRCVGTPSFGSAAELSDDPFGALRFVSYDVGPGPLQSLSCPVEQTCFVASQSDFVTMGRAPEYQAADLRRLIRTELVATPRLTVASPIAGALAVAWFSDGRLVGVGGRTFSRPGKKTLTLSLTKLGVRLRDARSTRPVIARALLVVPGHSPLQGSRRLRPRWTRSASR